MSFTRCGWCGVTTMPDACSGCGRDPRTPYRQRGQQPPSLDDNAQEASGTQRGGRPRVTAAQARERLRIAHKTLGAEATIEQLAEQLHVDESTVKRWQKLAAG